MADALLDVLAEEVLGDLVHEVQVPDPPEAHHRQDVVVIELGADPLQERLVLLRFQDEILRTKMRSWFRETVFLMFRQHCRLDTNTISEIAFSRDENSCVMSEVASCFPFPDTLT